MDVMRSTRAASRVAPAAALLVCLGLVSGCGGDDPDEPDTAASTVEQRGECEAEAKVTGAVKASLSGEAFVVTENRSGPVVYKIEDGPTVLTVLGEDGETPAIAALATKKGGFSGAEGTIEVDPDGGGVELDTTLQGDGGASVDVVATITC